jgi:isoleucyl-tRNA synthetase
MTDKQPYPTVPGSPSFPAIEVDVLAQWEADGTFEQSIEQRDPGVNGANEYVFYDGPPFANGLPHYGHLLTGYVKDAVPRYQTMRGKRVDRRFGWDTHGLPAEVEAEKQLGVSGHKEIHAFGVARFNEACKTSVLRYTKDWERYVNRQARWVDFENDYKTLDLPYMESVMWAFKTLFDKGLIYQGYRVLPYCWRCETPLSNSETKLDDCYKMRQDPAVTVTFPLLGADGQPDGDVLLAWTTTPWTLPSNLACAVGPDIDYAVMAEMQPDGSTQRFILAEALVGKYAKELGEATQVATLKGTELVGRRYQPLFDFFAGHENAFQVCPADYVTTEDGTGVVHIAPAFGEEDKVVTDAVGIAVVNPVNESGRFTSPVTPYLDMQVFDANAQIIKDLRAAGRLVRHETYDHSYPHCWRCANPLIYRAVSSWFVEVTKFRDRMVELNQQITWVPSHVKEGSFGKWLENARDWSISRNRFWGSPIPVWKSDDPAYPRLDVYGSLDDIERDFGVRPTNLHRPDVDNLVRPNPDDPTGQSKMVRVPEVLDCWFESGSMPFAQVHYPFENKDWFEHHYPGDFIVEYIGQTRGWFYTLHVLATALFDRPSFRTCVAHGIVLGDDGLKMSKSLKNYPDVYEVFDTHGSDAMRWYLLSSPVLRGGDYAVTETGIRDAVRQVILPIWNTYSFFTMYANASGYSANEVTSATDPLDMYILGRLHVLVRDVTAQMDEYDLYGACASIRSFLDALTNWYVRRSRDRFWAGDEAAFDALYTVLVTLCRIAAPLLPLLSEAVYSGLTGSPEAPQPTDLPWHQTRWVGSSVHLTDWPSAATFAHDEAHVTAMDRVRDVCSAASAVRKAQGRRVRQPLESLKVAAPDAASLRPFTEIIADELNVKHVHLETDLASVATPVAKPIPAKLGPKLGNRMKDFMSAFKQHGAVVAQTDTGLTASVALADGVVITLDDTEFDFSWTVAEAQGDAWAALGANTGVVVLDVELTPALVAEGMARDAVRAIQQARKDADLHISDRIKLMLGSADPEVVAALNLHQDLIANEVLATSIKVADIAPWGSSETTIGDDDRPLAVLLERA